MNKKNFLLGDVENNRYPKTELGIQEVRMDDPIISYVRISGNLWRGLRPQFIPNLGPSLFWLFLQELCEFFWKLGLMLFDIPKDIGFLEFLVLSNIFGFASVNRVPNRTKTVNLHAYHLSHFGMPTNSKPKIHNSFDSSRPHGRLFKNKNSSNINSSNINEVIRAVLNFLFVLQKDLAGTKSSKKHQKQQKAQKCNKEKAQNGNSKQKI